jgi:GWxTD domain-containing protein
VWIITPEEKAAFKMLQNGETARPIRRSVLVSPRFDTRHLRKRIQKEEHYRRVAYANDHFGGRDPGWKTDRGRIYIVYGPPDRIITYSAQDSRRLAQDGQDYKGLPSKTWSYRYLEGVGMDVVIDFVDICSCGDIIE